MKIACFLYLAAAVVVAGGSSSKRRPEMTDDLLPTPADMPAQGVNPNVHVGSPQITSDFNLTPEEIQVLSALRAVGPVTNARVEPPKMPTNEIQASDALRAMHAQGVVPGARAEPPAPPSPRKPKTAADFPPKPEETQALPSPHARPMQRDPPIAHVGSPALPSALHLKPAEFPPTRQEIEALSALHSKHAPGKASVARVGPPTLPPAVAKLIAKYTAANNAFAHAN